MIIRYKMKKSLSVYHTTYMHSTKAPGKKCAFFPLENLNTMLLIF